jgi:hypothetical protein
VAGVAPIEVAGATRAHLPPRRGRQANLALHIIALTQVRMRASRGRASCNTKVAAGETHNEAMRCLKRKIADQSRGSCSPTIGDQRRPGEDTRGNSVIQRGWRNPTAISSIKSLPNPPTATLPLSQNQRLEKYRGSPD